MKRSRLMILMAAMCLALSGCGRDTGQRVSDVSADYGVIDKLPEGRGISGLPVLSPTGISVPVLDHLGQFPGYG